MGKFELSPEQAELIRHKAYEVEKTYKHTKTVIDKAALNGRIQGMFEVIVLLNNYKDEDEK